MVSTNLAVSFTPMLGTLTKYICQPLKYYYFLGNDNQVSADTPEFEDVIPENVPGKISILFIIEFMLTSFNLCIQFNKYCT